MGDKRRYCGCCDAETVVQQTWGNNGSIEYCPSCSFPYDFGGEGQ